MAATAQQWATRIQATAAGALWGIALAMVPGGDEVAAGAGRAAFEVPTAENTALQNTLKALYQGTDEIEGGTAGAIRQEALTGEPTKGVFHLQKGIERIRNLENILQRESLSEADKATAERELGKLRDAVRFAQERQ
jgi:hypothetical protein